MTDSMEGAMERRLKELLETDGSLRAKLMEIAAECAAAILCGEDEAPAFIDAVAKSGRCFMSEVSRELIRVLVNMNHTTRESREKAPGS